LDLSSLKIGDSFQGGKIAYLYVPGDPGYDPNIVQGGVVADADEPTALTWDEAMSAVYNKTTNEYDDWFVPNPATLDYLYTNRVILGGFSSERYWSSDDYAPTLATQWNFATGVGSVENKSNTYLVRAIRNFSIRKNALTVVGDTVLTGSLNVSGSIIANTITGSILATNGLVSSSNQIPQLFSLMQTTASLNTYTGSNDSVVQRLEQTTASLNTTTGSLIGITNGLMAVTASMKAETIFSGSSQIGEIVRLQQTTASLNTYTGSNDSVIARILQTTASLNNYTASAIGIDNGLMAYTASLKAVAVISSSAQIKNYNVFAITGSNTFIGNQTINGSLIQGGTSTATGLNAHVQGYYNSATGQDSHAEGLTTTAIGDYSHAEGSSATARGAYSHAEGNYTQANGAGSHAEGNNAWALGIASHAEGNYTVAAGNYQHVQGQYNITSSAQSAFIIGNGTDFDKKSNLVFASGSQFEITGSLNVTGSVFVNGQQQITGSLIVSASTNLTGSVTINGSRIDNAWTSYTPTWEASSNPAIGNGTITGAYKVIGKTCFVRGRIAMGSSTTYGSGDWRIGLPVAAINAYAIQIPASLVDGSGGTGWYNALMNGAVALNTISSQILVNLPPSFGGSAAGGISSIFPFTWGTGDELYFNGSYEIA
jgi:hypothetical protein